MLHPVHGVLRVVCSVSFFHSILLLGQNINFGFTDWSTFFHMFAVSPVWLTANCKDLWSRQLNVLLITDSPMGAFNLRSSFMVSWLHLIDALLSWMFGTVT
ncbi:hypothetical protein XENORESO_007183 [Xenotaenia resolanae]|uniref:Uncharacterized protein n=1 Tax=Xenotaenia resolanae TaxID=208358 RepID=A0ABV0VWW6_9TELE